MAVLTPVFPASLDTVVTLGEVANFAATTVGTGGVTSSATTVPITSTAAWPATGACVIGTEAISYTGKTSTAISGCIRGFDGTAAAAHAAGDPAYGGAIISAHHEALRGAILGIETLLGPNGADLITTLDGLYVWRADYASIGELLLGTGVGTYTNLLPTIEGFRLTVDPYALTGVSWQPEPTLLWTPAALGSSVLKAWYRADTVISPDGALVPEWRDMSGNANHATQVASTAQPFYDATTTNNLPGLDFTGGDRLHSPVSASVNDELVMVVGDIDSIAGASRTFVGSDATGGRQFTAASSSGLLRALGAGTTLFTSTFALSLDVPAVVGLKFAPTLATIYKDGDSQSGAHAATLTSSLTTIIGAITDSSTSPYDGTMSEILIVQPAPSDADRQRIEGYLAHKYGIALLAGHPYETYPPGIPLSKIQHSSAASKLLGRGSAAGAGPFQEITLGTNLSMSGTTLNGTGAGGVSDGDKGDITVSSSGTVWTVDNDAITYAKVQNVSVTDVVLGRSSAGAGDIQEIAFTAAARALADDVDAAAQRTTLGLGTMATQGAGAVAITGGSVVGITDLAIADGGTGASTAQAAINALTAVSGATNEHVLTKDTATGNAIFKASAAGGYTDEQARDAIGTALVAGNNIDITVNDASDTITIDVEPLTSVDISDFDEAAQDAINAMTGDTATIDAVYVDTPASLTFNVINDSITYAKMQNVSATDRLLGRATAGAGDPEEIVCTAAGRALIDDADAAAQRTTLGLGTMATQAASGVAITGGSVTGITDVTVADGGTGASTASAARTNLGLVIGTDVAAFSHTHTATAAMMQPIGDGTNLLPTGDYIDFWMPHAGTITKWRILGTKFTTGTTGSVQLDIKKATYANFPTFTSIVAADKPIVTTAAKAEGTALSGWTTAFSAGDCIRVVVDSAVAFSLITAGFEYTRTI